MGWGRGGKDLESEKGVEVDISNESLRPVRGAENGNPKGKKRREAHPVKKEGRGSRCRSCNLHHKETKHNVKEKRI